MTECTDQSVILALYMLGTVASGRFVSKSRE